MTRIFYKLPLDSTISCIENYTFECHFKKLVFGPLYVEF